MSRYTSIHLFYHLIIWETENYKNYKKNKNGKEEYADWEGKKVI